VAEELVPALLAPLRTGGLPRGHIASPHLTTTPPPTSPTTTHHPPPPHLTQVRGRAEALAKKMALPAYADKTPEAIKADDQEKMARTQAEAAQVEAAIADMNKLLLADS
jgi:hypothetical protein